MGAVHNADLASVARAIVEQLGGRWTGRGGMCRCPAHDDRSPSLSIRLGDYGLFYRCFAGCEVSDVLHAVSRLDRRALATAAGRASAPPLPSSDFMRRRLQLLWSQAERVGGTVAGRYLAIRGIRLDAECLRFHPRVPLGTGSDLSFRPAMLGAVYDGPDLVALHRTFLSPDRLGLAEDLDPPRRMLGRPGRGTVRLRRASTMLGLAEGIETALSAMQILQLPVWATLGTERLARVTIPLRITRLFILADDDRAGRQAAALAAEVHAQPGRSVVRWWPGRGRNDWNDRLRWP